MFDFFKKRQLIIAIVFTFFSLFAVILSQMRAENSQNIFSSTFQFIASPFYLSADFIADSVSSILNQYFYLVQTEEENIDLKQQIEKLRVENAALREAAHGFRRLAHVLDFQKNNTDSKVLAEVISEINVPYSDLLIINKGLEDGIFKNYGVITPSGMVGKVLSVHKKQAKIQLIRDARSKIPVLIERTRDKGLLLGRVDGVISVELIQREAELKIGDRVVASGLAGIFPKGLYVGEVRQINKENFGLFQSVFLKTVVNFSKLEEVFVLLKSKNSVRAPLFTRTD